MDFAQAHDSFREAKNFRLLKAIYISPPIREKIIDFEKALWSTYTAYKMSYEFPGIEAAKAFERSKADKEAAESALSEIERTMRAELSPEPEK